MEQILINLIAGALGGAGAGKASPTFDLVRLVISFPGWSEAGYSVRSLRYCSHLLWPLLSRAI